MPDLSASAPGIKWLTNVNRPALTVYRLAKAVRVTGAPAWVLPAVTLSRPVLSTGPAGGDTPTW